MSTSPVAFSFLYPLIRMHAKRVPQPAMDIAILDAAREFCLMSRYRQQSIPVDVQIGTSWYEITPPNTDEELIRIEAVQYNGQENPLPLYSAAQWEIDCRQQQQRPRFFYYEPPDYLVILPKPAASLASGLYVRCVLQPNATATTLDYTLVQQYDRVLAKGALKFLLRTNDSPWTNLRLADEMEQEFETGIASAKSSRQSDFRPRGLLTAVHRF
jgi:hypothetical protein